MVLVSCCGNRCAPCRRCGCVAHRPLPLARVASSAAGSAPLAPQTLTSGSSPTCIEITGYPVWVSRYLVLVTGLEPVRVLPQGILSPWCLPIPPHQHCTPNTITKIPFRQATKGGFYCHNSSLCKNSHTSSSVNTLPISNAYSGYSSGNRMCHKNDSTS